MESIGLVICYENYGKQFLTHSWFFSRSYESGYISKKSTNQNKIVPQRILSPIDDAVSIFTENPEIVYQLSWLEYI